MGPGGWFWLCLMGSALAWLFSQEWRRRPPGSPAAPPERVPLVLEEAPAERVASLTPPWQAELTAQLEAEGFERLGDFAYASTEFFWARIFLTPGRRAALLLVNWKEGGKYGAPLTSNLEIYSWGTFEGKRDFRLTACAQDGSTRLLTGANRPSPRQMALHLKMVFNAVGVKPLLAEHEERLRAWEREGARIELLERAPALAALAAIFSGSA
ncbi:MAG TPA: hypothetical protein VMU88_09955 [bacterium]|nr:hypothetical protein [bacterium]